MYSKYSWLNMKQLSTSCITRWNTIPNMVVFSGFTESLEVVNLFSTWCQLLGQCWMAQGLYIKWYQYLTGTDVMVFLNTPWHLWGITMSWRPHLWRIIRKMVIMIINDKLYVFILMPLLFTSNRRWNQWILRTTWSLRMFCLLGRYVTTGTLFFFQVDKGQGVKGWH